MPVQGPREEVKPLLLRNTQVQGPREEVKPLLLPVSLSIYLSWTGGYKVLLSL